MKIVIAGGSDKWDPSSRDTFTDRRKRSSFSAVPSENLPGEPQSGTAQPMVRGSASWTAVMF